MRLTAEEFAKRLVTFAGKPWQPTEAQLRLMREMLPSPPTKRQRIGKRLRSTLRFYEEIGFTTAMFLLSVGLLAAAASH